jgi:hypothetical protein
MFGRRTAASDIRLAKAAGNALFSLVIFLCGPPFRMANEYLPFYIDLTGAT